MSLNNSIQFEIIVHNNSFCECIQGNVLCLCWIFEIKKGLNLTGFRYMNIFIVFFYDCLNVPDLFIHTCKSCKVFGITCHVRVCGCVMLNLWWYFECDLFCDLFVLIYDKSKSWWVPSFVTPSSLYPPLPPALFSSCPISTHLSTGKNLDFSQCFSHAKNHTHTKTLKMTFIISFFAIKWLSYWVSIE